MDSQVERGHPTQLEVISGRLRYITGGRHAAKDNPQRNEIRQAEGPRPATIPSAEAWYWMDRWCEQEGIDLSTWDCYS